MLLKRTLSVVILLALLMGTVIIGLSHSRSAAGQDDAEAKIASAMSAAPSTISENAAILDLALDANGKFVVLRDGTNVWSCFPDQAGTPALDPMCLDEAWLNWLYALFTGAEPNTTVVGLAYMLQGGSDASNTDPAAVEPAEGEEWLNSPPHVMFIQPEALDQTVYSTDHHTPGPWIMWAGTPYEHVMMPVVDAEHET